MRHIYFIAIISVLLFSCKSSNDQDAAAQVTTSTQKSKTNKAVANNSNVEKYPGVTEGMIRRLMNQCDYVDYIFYNLPISISQDDKKAILSNINFIAKTSPESIPATCKPMGRKSFQKNGEIMIEADIYINVEEKCFFYVFYENGKKAYANHMTADGINFYYNVFGQAGVKR